MSVKTKFDKLLKQVTDVDYLIQQVTVVGKKDEFIEKLKSIKQKCNSISIPKVTVTQSSYDTSLQPMIPITGQSRLNICSMKAIFGTDQTYLDSQVPEDWEVTWETGAIDCLIVEYMQFEEKVPTNTPYPMYVEVYDITQCLQPVIGTGVMDIDENYQYFGEYLGSIDSTAHLSEEKKDFHGQLIVPGVGRRLHIAPQAEKLVTGESVVKEGDVYWSRRHNTLTDFTWFEVTSVKVVGSVLTVSVSRMSKGYTYTELWTAWKKVELRSGGTIACMMASIQADGGFKLIVADEKHPSIEKVKQLIQRIYIDKE